MPAIYLSVQDHPACIGLAAVFVNGIEEKLCSAAHEGEGWADCDRVDANGRPLIVGDEVPTDRVYGVVEIRPVNGATRADLERIAAGERIEELLP